MSADEQGDDRPRDTVENGAAPLHPERRREADSCDKESVSRDEGKGQALASFIAALREHAAPLLIDEVSGDAASNLERAKHWVRSRPGTTIVHAFKFKGEGIAPSWNLVVQPGEDPSQDEWTRIFNHAASTYAPLNPCRVPPESLKASKHHVIEVRCLGVDLDVAEPPADCADQWQHQLDGRSAIVSVVEEYARRQGLPTECRDTGGGFQLVFKLSTPVALPPAQLDADGFMLRKDGITTKEPRECALNPDRERVIADIEARNRGLFEQVRVIVAELGAAHLVKVDATQNIDRIFRVPFTPNRPCGKKRGRGRRPTMTRLVFDDQSIVYEVESFPAAVDRKAGSKAAVDVPRGTKQRVNLDDLPRGVSGRCKVVIVQGKDDEQRLDGEDQTRSAWLFYAVCELVRAGVDDKSIYAVITDRDYEVSKSVLDKGNSAQIHRYALRQIKRAKEEIAQATTSGAQEGRDSKLFVFRGKWDEAAAAFVRDRFEHLVHTNGDFYVYRGPHYELVEDATVESEAWKFLRESLRLKYSEGKAVATESFNPNSEAVSTLVKATKAFMHKPADTYTPPCWIDLKEGDPDPDDVIAVRNGLLRVSTGELVPATPRFFTLNRVDVEYDRDAACPLWLEKMQEVFDGDDRVGLLQEVMGYLLVPDTSQQKAFLLVGPTRSFKGTVMRIVKRLVGARNYGPLNPNHLKSSTFALQPLIGKSVAVVPDLRLGLNTDPALVQVLLNIAGEDDVTIDRKNKPHWQGKLSCRVLAAAVHRPEYPASLSR